MKKFYTRPEFEVTLLLAEDILTVSVDITDNEVEINGDNLFD